MAQYNQMQLTSYVDQILRKLERLETQLRLVSEKVGVPMEDPRSDVPAEVVALVQEGNRLGAIGKYRELTGAGIDEAKAKVEEL
jgi:ribosomal protein L7/L12